MIQGLTYLSNWIDSETESKLLKKIEEGTWENSLKRKVQQFGPVYNYSSRKLDSSCKEIPVWMKEILYPGLKILFDKEPNQIIINEYEIGQGITKHVDAQVFGPTIASLSLVNDTNIFFGQNKNSEKRYILERRSLIIMSSQARYDWHHYIPPVTQKRISITFRTT